MALLCRTCSRANPANAHFCYFDGSSLGNAAGLTGPLAVGAQRFVRPFVFPSGRSCASFDELVLACENNWQEARELLRKGYLESFLSGLGRADLATASHQAAQTNDLDRGLDDLLNKLPGSARQVPKLQVNPLELSLGRVQHGKSQSFALQINNVGMGLLHGSIAGPNTPWLALGDAPGMPQKHFQCRDDISIPVQVLGKALRAHNKVQEGKLVIESNGGQLVVVVRIEVPVQPYPDGLLAGAKSPRQVAEKAKANPREAAPYLEKGAVAAWYQSNGWTYPVQGPPASGLAALQQYFEALGLVNAPKVEISTQRLQLTGIPGTTLDVSVQVQTTEKKPVFAHATTTTPWIQVGKPVLSGATARIPLRIPSVPAAAGSDPLRGQVQVIANGNQRFNVEVNLTVTGGRGIKAAAPVLSMDQAMAAPAHQSSGDWFASTSPVLEVAAADIVEVTDAPRPGRQGGGTGVLNMASVMANAGPVPQVRRGRDDSGEERFTKHLIPLGVLALALLVMLIHDLLLPASHGPGASADSLPINPRPFLALHFHDGPKGVPEGATGKDPMPVPTMRFGLVMMQAEGTKKLTFDKWGRSNNTCIMVDGVEYLFGEPGDQRAYWVDQEVSLGKESGRERDGKESIWMLKDPKVRVTQHIEIVPGEPGPGETQRRLNTCLVSYTLTNEDNKPHRVGIRFLLDTFIGANDGVPFTIPGDSALCDTMKEFRTPAEVPDYIQALENEDLRNPGTVAHLQFRLGKQLEAPSRVLLGRWPDISLQRYPPGYPQAKAQNTLWEVPLVSMRSLQFREDGQNKRIPPDSAVTMYWPEQDLSASATRKVGVSYGLGQVSGSESGGKLLLTVGGRLVRGGEFTVTALVNVNNPTPGETLTLELPSGLRIAQGAAQQAVPRVDVGSTRSMSPVTWKVIADRDGKYQITVKSSTGISQSLAITILSKGVFD